MDLKQINLPLISSALQVYRTLKGAGFETYLVGGWVRNYLINYLQLGDKLSDKFSSPNLSSDQDIDFTTQAHPEEVIKLFKHTIPTGIKHGTITVIIDKHAYEVTTFRSDGKYSDSRRPDEISFSDTLEEDLKRRDFTINAFAYDVDKKKIIDLYGGIDDLKKKTIKAIGKPKERFEEDALRMMRACRFASQLGFDIEEATKQAIQETAEKITHISQERIRDELIKLVVGKDAIKGLEYMRESGLLAKVLPELQETVEVAQNKYHQYDVYQHSLQVLKEVNQLQTLEIDQKKLSQPSYPSYQLSLACLFHDIAKPQARREKSDGEATFYGHEVTGVKMSEDILRRLKFSKKDIVRITNLVRHHMFHYTPEWKDGTVRRFLSRVGIENLTELFLLRKADRLGKGKVEMEEENQDNQDLVELQSRIDALLKEKLYLKISDLAIGGDDLKSLVPPGPKMGRVLQQLLELVIEDPSLNKKEILLEQSRNLISPRK